MSDARLVAFADRIAAAKKPIAASTICKEALVLLAREDFHKEIPPFLLGKTCFLARSTTEHQYGVWFFIPPSALKQNLDKLVSEYIRPAMAWLQTSIPMKWEYLLPSGLENLCGGDIDSAIERYDSIEMRCVVCKQPTDRYLGANVGVLVSEDWITYERWYDVNEDKFIENVPVALSVRLDVRLAPKGASN